MIDPNLYETSNLYHSAIIYHVRRWERGDPSPVSGWWKSPVTGYVTWIYEDALSCQDIVARYESRRLRVEPNGFAESINRMKQYKFAEQ